MNTSENGEIEDFGQTTEAVTEQASEPADQDTTEPAEVQDAPEQPTSGDGNVVGRRNEDLPLDGGPAEEPTSEGDSDNS